MSISHLEKKATFWFSHITELIELWEKSEFTAASVKQRFMSGKRYLGSKDKKVVSGVFFFYLRHKMALEGLSIEEIFFLAYLKENDVNSSVNRIFKNNEFNTYIYGLVNPDKLEFNSNFITKIQDNLVQKSDDLDNLKETYHTKLFQEHPFEKSSINILDELLNDEQLKSILRLKE